MPLTGAAARSLRALAHPLTPVVHVGKLGVTDEVVTQVAGAILVHELIKVKILSEAPEDRHTIAEALSERTGTELVQLLGRIVVLYRPHPKKPKIAIPKGYTPKPKTTTHAAEPAHEA